MVFSGSLHSLKCQHPQIAWRWGLGPLEHNEHTFAHSITNIDARAHEHTHTQDMHVLSCALLLALEVGRWWKGRRESWEADVGMEKTRGLDKNRTGHMFHRCCSLVMWPEPSPNLNLVTLLSHTVLKTISIFVPGLSVYRYFCFNVYMYVWYSETPWSKSPMPWVTAQPL